jgi:hypothetical protein
MGGFPAQSYTPFNLSGATPSYGDTYSSPAGAGMPSYGASDYNFAPPNLSSALTGGVPSYDTSTLGGGSVDGTGINAGVSTGDPIAGLGGPLIGGHSGFFGNMTGEQKIGLGIGGLKTLGSLWMGLKQLSLAKKQFAFQRDFANTNLANSMKTYNTALAGRARAQGFTEGSSQGDVANYVQQNSLSKAGGPAAVTSIMPLPGAGPTGASGSVPAMAQAMAQPTSVPRRDYNSPSG